MYLYKQNKYKAIKITKNGGKARYMAPVKVSVKSIQIPGKIKIKGKVLQVTEIDKKAFAMCKKLKKISTTQALRKKYKKLLKKSVA